MKRIILILFIFIVSSCAPSRFAWKTDALQQEYPYYKKKEKSMLRDRYRGYLKNTVEKKRNHKRSGRFNNRIEKIRIKITNKTNK